MDEDLEIELPDTDAPDASDVQLPVNFISFGEIENDDVKVYIKQDVYQALEEYALEDTEHERGTIILGDYCEKQGKIHVIISNYIEARYADASASTLTFTHKTWDYVHKEHDKKYSDKKIVGWQHTHPSYGIFLSNYDLFIQENFFDLPFQVAYVIDPIQNIRGFFQWKNGKTEKLRGFYIYDEVGKQIKIEVEKPKKKEKSKPKKHGKLLYALITLLLVVSVVLSAATALMIKTVSVQKEEQEKILAQIDSQKETISKLQEQLKSGEADSVSSKELTEKVENHDAAIHEQEEEIKELKEAVGDDGDSVVRFKAYTVKPGDTLTAICDSEGVDYGANEKIILAVNGMDDPGKIYVGQTILLPIKQ